MNTQSEIIRLQKLIAELGIQAVTVKESGHAPKPISIDWNGEEELFASATEAEKEIRSAAE